MAHAGATRWLGLSLTGLLLWSCGAPMTPGPVPLGRQALANMAQEAAPQATPVARKRSRPQPKPPGSDDEAPVSQSPDTPAPSKDKPADKPSPAKPGKGTQADADEMLQEAIATLQTTQTYKATVSIYDQIANGSKAAATRKLSLTYKAPGKHRIDIVETTNPIQNGMKLSFTVGEPNAKIRGGGLLGVVAMTLALNDDKLTTQNDWRLDHVVGEGIANRLKSGYKAEVAGTTTVGGEQVTVLKLTTANNALSSAIDYELFGIDGNKMMRLWSCYAKAELNLPNNLLYQMSLDQFTPNVSVSDDTFRF